MAGVWQLIKDWKARRKWEQEQRGGEVEKRAGRQRLVSDIFSKDAGRQLSAFQSLVRMSDSDLGTFHTEINLVGKNLSPREQHSVIASLSSAFPTNESRMVREVVYDKAIWSGEIGIRFLVRMADFCDLARKRLGGVTPAELELLLAEISRRMESPGIIDSQVDAMVDILTSLPGAEAKRLIASQAFGKMSFGTSVEVFKEFCAGDTGALIPVSTLEQFATLKDVIKRSEIRDYDGGVQSGDTVETDYGQVRELAQAELLRRKPKQ